MLAYSKNGSWDMAIDEILFLAGPACFRKRFDRLADLRNGSVFMDKYTNEKHEEVN
jgi:hypothetical protein